VTHLATDTARRGVSDVQGLWLPLLQLDWKSLAVVPVGPRCSAKPFVAELPAIAQLGVVALEVVDATGAPERERAALAAHVGNVAAAGKRVVVAVDPPLASVSGVSAIAIAEAAVLVATLEEVTLGEARRTLELVGRRKVIGSFTLRKERPKWTELLLRR
jgi:hypothetical protein